ncbi:MAG TPA: SigB/SigF/SigG family RNA polymerase sigma factor [Candidatus Onthoplasma faecigallinarum]|nr:SigB/SigF/SigG family RNA polymerase sigma factor [Candidatus Onthoplasma faecigallinarum]
MLTNEQTSNLLEQAKKGDDLAKEKLITLNSPLIKSIVKRYLNKGIEYDDLYQLGALGFVKAINNYDPSFNVKFTTYAVPMIAGEIKRFLRDDGSVKVSRSLKHTAIMIKNYVYEYNKEHGENPSLENLEKKFNMDKNDIVFALEANSTPLSLNEKYNGDEDSTTILDKLTDDFSFEKYIDKLAIREMINKLSAREKQVIIMRYYLDKTQAEIAKELGVSQVQVSRIENKVLQEFKEGINP